MNIDTPLINFPIYIVQLRPEPVLANDGSSQEKKRKHTAKVKLVFSVFAAHRCASRLARSRAAGSLHVRNKTHAFDLSIVGL